MTTVAPFKRCHMAKFHPGEEERRQFHARGRGTLMKAMNQDAALTILDGPRVLGFVGVYEKDDELHLWSMWSAEARRDPLPMARAIKRLLPIWRQECGRELVTTDDGEEPKARFAAWLGLSQRAPGVWVI